MRQVKFVEEEPTIEGERGRLLVAILDYEVSPEIDGGRRQAVRVATTEDVAEFPLEYATYVETFKKSDVPGVTTSVGREAGERHAEREEREERGSSAPRRR